MSVLDLRSQDAPQRVPTIFLTASWGLASSCSLYELSESQLQELSTSLREAGFANAVLDVRVDPARLYKIQETVEQTLPQEGSLLSLRV